MRIRSARGAAVLLYAVVVASAFTACSSGSKGAPSDFCKNISSMNANIQTLDSTPVSEATLPTLTSSLQQLNGTVKSLSSAGSADYGPQVDALTTTADALRKSLAETTANPTPAGYAKVQADRDAFTSAADDLTSASKDAC